MLEQEAEKKFTEFYRILPLPQNFAPILFPRNRHGGEPRTTPTTRKGRLRGVSAVPKMLPCVSERSPFAKLQYFGVFRLFRGFD